MSRNRWVAVSNHGKIKIWGWARTRHGEREVVGRLGEAVPRVRSFRAGQAVCLGSGVAGGRKESSVADCANEEMAILGQD